MEGKSLQKVTEKRALAPPRRRGRRGSIYVFTKGLFRRKEKREWNTSMPKNLPLPEKADV